MKLTNTISANEDFQYLNLSELINIEDMQSMMDSFYKLSKIPMAIIDLKGNVLVGVGWQEICLKFHRIHPETLKNCLESDILLTANIPKGKFKLYKCKNGMWDMATPIYIKDQHLGNLFIGQFFFSDETVDYKYFWKQATSYNFNKEEYIKSLNLVPHLDKENIENAKTFFIKLADSLSQLIYTNIKLVRSIKEAEKLADSLKESKAHLERSQEIAHLGSWELDLINNKLTWSDEVYRIFGLAPREFEATYEAFLEAVHPDDRVAVDKAYSESLRRNSNTYEISHRIIRKKTGEVRFVHEKCEHFKDKSGKIIRSVGMVHDITEQKKVENELRASKEKLSLALDVGNICVWEWDLQKDIITFGERLERMLGLKPAFAGINYNEFETVVHEEDVSHFRNTFFQAINDDTPIETIFRTRPKNGKFKYLNTKAVIYKNANNNPVKIAGVFFDITALKEGTDKVFLDLHNELLRSNKELENFAYVASHDLQEPLRMVSSFTELLSQKYKDKMLDETAQEYIRYAVEGSKRMYGLINGLLSYSRIQTKGKAFEYVDLNHVIESVKKNLSLAIKERNVVLNVKVLPGIMADESQMIQLFQNLISNSIKFCTGSPKISISSRKRKSDIIFSVKDNGLGIDSQYFEKIFQIFQRLLPKDQFEGTGIGLSICKRIVERHGGKIWVESVPEKSSTFYFTLPKNNI